jgi:hypothetical protein
VKPFFSRPLRDNPLAWILAVAAICTMLWVLSQSCQCVSLEIIGRSSGQGFQNLSFTGDVLNISLLQNGSSWNLLAMGAA